MTTAAIGQNVILVYCATRASCATRSHLVSKETRYSPSPAHKVSLSFPVRELLTACRLIKNFQLLTGLARFLLNTIC